MARIGEKEFARTILHWFDSNKRVLPWRDTRDPYLIWLSEVILQQTRVAQGLAYYKSLTQAFPTVAALAKASESRVLRLWQGLGYYSRARNLHRCARLVNETMRGEFPRTYNELIKLPGVGPYTAAAIASIAFDERVTVVDGNVYRVLSRIFCIDADIQSPAGKKVFRERAESLVPARRAGDFNQAIMELGAIQCLPRNPDCSLCPFTSVCEARLSDSIQLLPVKKKKARIRARYLNYFVFSSGGKLAMRERRGSDIWKGLYDFHLVETSGPATARQLANGDLRGLAGKRDISAIAEMRHQLTHQLLHITFYHVPLAKKILTKILKVNPDLAFYSVKRAARLPKPVPVKLMLDQIGTSGKEKMILLL